MDPIPELTNIREITTDESNQIYEMELFLASGLRDLEIFNGNFDPLNIDEYTEAIKDLIQEYNDSVNGEEEEPFSKLRMGSLRWKKDLGLIIEAIDFSKRLPKKIECAIKEMLNTQNPSYIILSSVLEYLQDIEDTDALLRFLSNPGVKFEDENSSLNVETKNLKISFYKKRVVLSKEEMSSINGWRYIPETLFNLFKETVFTNKGYRGIYFVKMVEQTLRGEGDLRGRDIKGIFTVSKYKGQNYILRVLINKQS